MTTSEERLQILRMVEEGKVSAEEGARLLAALSGVGRTASEAPTNRPEPRWLRVRVTDLGTGRPKVNINIPMSLVNVGLKMGARFAPNVEGVDAQTLLEVIRSGQLGRVIDVSDEETGEHVEVFVE